MQSHVDFCGLFEVPLALERCSSADSGNPEADLARHIEPRTVNHCKSFCVRAHAERGIRVPARGCQSR